MEKSGAMYSWEAFWERGFITVSAVGLLCFPGFGGFIPVFRPAWGTAARNMNFLRQVGKETSDKVPLDTSSPDVSDSRSTPTSYSFDKQDESGFDLSTSTL